MGLRWFSVSRGCFFKLLGSKFFFWLVELGGEVEIGGVFGLCVFFRFDSRFLRSFRVGTGAVLGSSGGKGFGGDWVCRVKLVLFRFWV